MKSFVQSVGSIGLPCNVYKHRAQSVCEMSAKVSNWVMILLDGSVNFVESLWLENFNISVIKGRYQNAPRRVLNGGCAVIHRVTEALYMNS